MGAANNRSSLRFSLGGNTTAVHLSPTGAARGRNLGPAGSERIVIASYPYILLVDDLYRQHPGGIRLQEAEFLLTQLDLNLFAYFSAVEGFDSEGTLRFVDPGYTNISDGVGVFGTLNHSSDTIALADSI